MTAKEKIIKLGISAEQLDDMLKTYRAFKEVDDMYLVELRGAREQDFPLPYREILLIGIAFETLKCNKWISEQEATEIQTRIVNTIMRGVNGSDALQYLLASSILKTGGSHKKDTELTLLIIYLLDSIAKLVRKKTNRKLKSSDYMLVVMLLDEEGIKVSDSKGEEISITEDAIRKRYARGIKDFQTLLLYRMMLAVLSTLGQGTEQNNEPEHDETEDLTSPEFHGHLNNAVSLFITGNKESDRSLSCCPKETDFCPSMPNSR